MKKFSALAVLVFVYLVSIVFCSAAVAAQTQKYWFYDQFTMQTPDDWTVEKGNQTVSLLNADKSSRINIMVVAPVPENSREFAAIIFAPVFEKFKDLEMKEVGDGLLTFTYESDGVMRRNIVGVVAANGIMINVVGNDPAIEEALKSLKLKLTFISSAWGVSLPAKK